MTSEIKLPSPSENFLVVVLYNSFDKIRYFASFNLLKYSFYCLWILCFINFSFSPLSNYANNLTSIRRVRIQLFIDDKNTGEPY